MKIAVITDDMKTISAHFGRAQSYLVFTIENGKISAQESRPKANHNHFASQEQGRHAHTEPHGTDAPSEVKHTSMIEPIIDCDVLLAGGMGQGAYNSLVLRSIQPTITDIQDARAAVMAYLDGSMIDHTERLH